jgi:hypothetical protein
MEDLFLPLLWLSDDRIPVLEKPRDEGERRVVIMLGDASEFAKMSGAYRAAGVPLEVAEEGDMTVSPDFLRPAAQTGDAVLLVPGTPGTVNEIEAIADDAWTAGVHRLVVLYDRRGLLEGGAMASLFDPDTSRGTGWVITLADWETHADRIIVVPRSRTGLAIDIGLLRDGRQLPTLG